MKHNEAQQRNQSDVPVWLRGVKGPGALLISHHVKICILNNLLYSAAGCDAAAVAAAAAAAAAPPPMKTLQFDDQQLLTVWCRTNTNE